MILPYTCCYFCKVLLYITKWPFGPEMSTYRASEPHASTVNFRYLYVTGRADHEILETCPSVTFCFMKKIIF